MEKAASMVWPTLDPRPTPTYTVVSPDRLGGDVCTSSVVAQTRIRLHTHARPAQTHTPQCQPGPGRRPSASCIAAAQWRKGYIPLHGPDRTRTDFVGHPHGPNGVSRRPGPQTSPCGSVRARVVEFSYKDAGIAQASERCQSIRLAVKVKFSHTRYRALGPELIPVYRQSARR